MTIIPYIPFPISYILSFVSNLFAIFISTCLVNNLVLNHLLGLPPGIALARKINVALGLSGAMTLILSVTAAVTFTLNHELLIPLDLAYLEPGAMLLINAVVLAILDLILRHTRPHWHANIGVFFPLAYINSAVLGTALLSAGQSHGIVGALVFGLGSGVGYGLVMTMLAAMEERLAVADIPAPFRGISIILITLGIMSMAFMGFTGLVSR